MFFFIFFSVIMIDFNKKFFVQEISSTHKIIQKNEFDCGSWILANKQTAGIGQHNRIWQEVGKQNIYFSAKVCIDKPFFSLQLLPILTSGALLKTIQKTFPKEKIFWKWINDLYKEDRKIAGILLETFILSHKITLIISIGLNLVGNYEHSSETLKNKVGFLLRENLQQEKKEEFITNLIHSINSIFSIKKQEDLQQEFQFLDRYNYLKDKKLTFSVQKKQIKATFDKIDFESGELYLKDEKRKTYPFYQSPPDFTIYH